MTGTSTAQVGLTVGANTPVGLYRVTIGAQGTSMAQNMDVYVQVTKPMDFTMSQPAAVTLNAGGQVSFSMSVAPSGGFTGTVGLAPAGVSGGPQASFNPASLTFAGGNVPQTVTATVSAAVTVPNFNYSVSLVAASGIGASSTVMHSVSLPVKVLGGPAADFSLPSDFSVNVPVNVTTPVSFTISGNAALVGTASISGSGVGLIFSPGTGAAFGGNGAAVATSSIGLSASAAGTYSARISVIVGTVTHLLNVQVTAVAPISTPGFTLNWAGPTLVTAGQAVTGYVYVSPQSGYSGNIDGAAVNVTSLAAGITAVAGAHPAIGAFAVRLSAAVGAQTGSVAVTVNDGAHTAQLVVPVGVAAAVSPLTLSATPTYVGLGSAVAVTAKVSGGSPPYTYAWTGNFSTTGQAMPPGGYVYQGGQTDYTFSGVLTLGAVLPQGVTGRQMTPQVTDNLGANKSVNVAIADHVVPTQAQAYAAAFREAVNLEAFGDYLDRHGYSGAYVRSIVPIAAGLTAPQYQTLVTEAKAYMADYSTVLNATKSSVALHAANGTVPGTAQAPSKSVWNAQFTSRTGIAENPRASESPVKIWSFPPPPRYLGTKTAARHSRRTTYEQIRRSFPACDWSSRHRFGR